MRDYHSPLGTWRREREAAWKNEHESQLREWRNVNIRKKKTSLDRHFYSTFICDLFLQIAFFLGVSSFSLFNSELHLAQFAQNGNTLNDSQRSSPSSILAEFIAHVYSIRNFISDVNISNNPIFCKSNKLKLNLKFILELHKHFFRIYLFTSLYLAFNFFGYFLLFPIFISDPHLFSIFPCSEDFSHTLKTLQNSRANDQLSQQIASRRQDSRSAKKN